MTKRKGPGRKNTPTRKSKSQGVNLVVKTFYLTESQSDALEADAANNGLGGSAMLRLILNQRYNPSSTVSVTAVPRPDSDSDSEVTK